MRIEPGLRRFERHVESAIFWQPSRLRYRCARRCMVSTALFLLAVSLTGCSEKGAAAAGSAARKWWLRRSCNRTFPSTESGWHN